MEYPGWNSYDSYIEDINANSSDIIKFSQGFISKGKGQGNRVQQGRAKGMALERRDWRDQRSKENVTTGEAKDWLLFYSY